MIPRYLSTSIAENLSDRILLTSTFLGWKVVTIGILLVVVTLTKVSNRTSNTPCAYRINRVTACQKKKISILSAARAKSSTSLHILLRRKNCLQGMEVIHILGCEEVNLR